MINLVPVGFVDIPEKAVWTDPEKADVDPFIWFAVATDSNPYILPVVDIPE